MDDSRHLKMAQRTTTLDLILRYIDNTEYSLWLESTRINITKPFAVVCFSRIIKPFAVTAQVHKFVG